MIRPSSNARRSKSRGRRNETTVRSATRGTSTDRTRPTTQHASRRTLEAPCGHSANRSRDLKHGEGAGERRKGEKRRQRDECDRSARSASPLLLETTACMTAGRAASVLFIFSFAPALSSYPAAVRFSEEFRRMSFVGGRCGESESRARWAGKGTLKGRGKAIASKVRVFFLGGEAPRVDIFVGVLGKYWEKRSA
jgi:hypothetical protein